MPSWPAKDPDSTLDYLYTIPLADGDAVASHAFALLSGTVTIDSESRSGADVTAWLSGGTDGETNVFRVSWTTVGGRTDDDIITLATAANEITELALTGYAKPDAAHLILRYPAFVAVKTDTVRYWLTDAERGVDESWSEADYAAGLMALAAHNMTLAGQGAEAAATADLPAGITSMKIGTLGLAFDHAITRAKATGSLESTRYGSEYMMLLRRNRGGPRVAPTGTVPYDPRIRYPQGQA